MKQLVREGAPAKTLRANFPQRVIALFERTGNVYDEKEIAWQRPDVPGGITLGSTRAKNDTPLFFMHHDNAFTAAGQPIKDRDVNLVYTVNEWASFILGVKDGEFDDMIDVPEEALQERMLLFRDSKDPDGPLFGVNALEYAVFLGAIKRGKYNIPEEYADHVSPQLQHEKASWCLTSDTDA